MKAMNLSCKIKKARRKTEIKNMKVKFKDLVQREYNAKNIIATDVSYIPTKKGFFIFFYRYRS